MLGEKPLSRGICLRAGRGGPVHGHPRTLISLRALISRSISLGLQVVPECPPADLGAGGQAVLAREPVVDAAVNAAQRRFRRGGAEARETPGHAGQGVGSRDERHVVSAVEQRQHGCRGRTEGAVPDT